MVSEVKYAFLTCYNALYLNQSTVFYLNETKLLRHLYFYNVHDDDVDALIITISSEQARNPH